MQDVEDWRIAVDEGVRAGMVCRERKGEPARDLLRVCVLRGKGLRLASKPHVGFRAYGRGPARIWGRPGTSDY